MKVSKKVAEQYTKAYVALIDLSNKISENDTSEIKEFGDIKVGDIYVDQKNIYFYIKYIDFTRGYLEFRGPRKIHIVLESIDPSNEGENEIVDIIQLLSYYERVDILKKNLHGFCIGDEFKLKKSSVGREGEVVGFLNSKNPFVLIKVRMDDFGFPIYKEKGKTWKKTIDSRKKQKATTIEKLYLARPKDLENIEK